MASDQTPRSNIEALRALIDQKSTNHKQQAELISAIISSGEWNALETEDQQLILKDGYLSSLFTGLLTSGNDTSEEGDDHLHDNERIAAKLFSNLSNNNSIYHLIPHQDQTEITKLVFEKRKKNPNFLSAIATYTKASRNAFPKPLTWKEWVSTWFRIIGICLLFLSALLTPFITKAFAASIIDTATAGIGAIMFAIGDLCTRPKDWGESLDSNENKFFAYLLAVVLIAAGVTVILNLVLNSPALDFVSQDTLAGGLPAAFAFGAFFIGAGVWLFKSNWSGTNAYERSLVMEHSEYPAIYHPSSTYHHPSSSAQVVPDAATVHPAVVSSGSDSSHSNSNSNALSV